MMQLPYGPLMIDIAGTGLSDLDRERLCHPLVGGIILFTRNYADPEQLAALAAEIHALRKPPLLIAVDHEGGRVQRFRDGFTRLPAMAALGRLWDQQPEAAVEAARQTGYVLASELRACGVDYSFTPVLDLDYAEDSVAGTDGNFVLTGRGRLIEVQMSAEGATFSRDEMAALMDLAEAGAQRLVAAQLAAISG